MGFHRVELVEQHRYKDDPLMAKCIEECLIGNCHHTIYNAFYNRSAFYFTGVDLGVWEVWELKELQKLEKVEQYASYGKIFQFWKIWLNKYEGLMQNFYVKVTKLTTFINKIGA